MTETETKEFCKSNIRELIEISVSQDEPEELREFAKNTLLEIKNEVDMIILEFERKPEHA